MAFAAQPVMAGGVVRGDDCTAACVGCNPNPGMAGGMYYVGPCQGDYMAQSTYRYVGYGGDFSSVRRRRDFTCLLTTLLLSLALLFLVWWWWPVDECYVDQMDWQYKWTRARQIRCCARTGIGCKNGPTPQPGPVDPFNCALGYLNWQAGWSTGKKSWCCKVHGKGCGSPGPSQAAEYDCNAGYQNWVKGWSMNKKNWCCERQRKGCPGSGMENMLQAAGHGFGAGATSVMGAPPANQNLGTAR